MPENFNADFKLLEIASWATLKKLGGGISAFGAQYVLIIIVLYRTETHAFLSAYRTGFKLLVFCPSSNLKQKQPQNSSVAL